MISRVSVIIPTRDRPAPLRRALRSIAAQQPTGAGHTHPVAEVIVVYDQSQPDRSLEDEFADLDLQVVGNRRSPGLAGAHNTGLDIATSEWIAFCGDDDEWAPSKLRDQASTSDVFPDADFIVGNVTVAIGRRRVARSAGMDRIGFDDLLGDRIPAAHPSTFLVRRSAIDGYIGEFDENLPGSFAEDYDWLLRAARHAPIAVAPQNVAFIGRRKTSFFDGRWQMIDRALARLVEKHPELATHQRGMARIQGQRAFAQASMGDRDRALSTVRQSMRLNWLEPRLYLTVPVAFRLVSGTWLVRLANRFGRGI